jgi:DNA polymerase-3 subunit gamma/tau
MSDYRALYRKWRPRDFDDIQGQAGITDILKYEVLNSKLSHAYLFCGSRGTGKTSCAKILAKAVNCLNPKNGNPCNECEACRSIDQGIATDVIEMDAASNNGINDVRDMQDEIAFTPALLKYRVYIIDEVHMMSTQAFNALLKTLEEPPEYVIFILATTEYHKLPTTIVSRCQRFDFKRISSDCITARLLYIAKEEGVEITEDAARVIARISRGGLRDAISLFELCTTARRPITDTLVFDTVGTGNRESTYKVIESILNADYTGVYSVINDIVMTSSDISVFWQELIDSYRDLMVVKNSREAKVYLDLTEPEYATLKRLAGQFNMPRLAYHVSLLEGAMSDMQRAFNSKRSIAEIALTRMCDARLSTSPEALVSRIEELERQISIMKLSSADQKAPPVLTEQAPPKQESVQSAPTPVSTALPKSTVEVEARVYSDWGEVLDRIAELKRPLYSGLVSATVHKSGRGNITIATSDFFAKRLLSNEADMNMIRGVIAEHEGISASEITLEIKVKGAAPTVGVLSEIENALK